MNIPIIDGMVVSKTGRPWPAPKLAPITSERSAKEAITAMHEWLLRTGRAEALARHDDWMQTLMAGMGKRKGRDGERLTQADADTLNEYLFGDTDNVLAPYRQETML